MSVAASLHILSCGGEQQDQQRGLEGQLIDGPVGGVAYETATLSGVTDIQGTFRYEEGESVRFSIGDTILGEVVGKSLVSPFDLVPDAEVLSGNFAVGEAIQNDCDPFQQVINTAVLLQTLDRDGDPENGIEITEAVATLFEGVSLRLDREHRRFVDGIEFRRIMAEANAQELLDDHRAPRNAGFAMQHLYAALGVDARLGVATRRDSDIDGDLTVDRTRSWSYDEKGQLLSIEEDGDGDGVVDERDTFEYDDNGNQVRFVSDDDGDGSPDSITTDEFNADGRRIRNGTDRNADGEDDSVRVFEYDELGRRTLEMNDNNGDGNPESVRTFVYDDAAMQRRSFRDTDGDGELDESELFQLDEDGNVIRSERDLGADGTINGINVWTYDASGNPIRFEADRDGNGSIDEVTTTEYQGCLRTFEQTDTDGDGEPNRTASFEYNEAGQWVRESRDTNGDGMPDRETSYEYDEQGRLIRRAIDRDGDTAIDDITLYTYDADGNRTEIQYDSGADGVELIDTFTNEPTSGWWNLFFDD